MPLEAVIGSLIDRLNEHAMGHLDDDVAVMVLEPLATLTGELPSGAEASPTWATATPPPTGTVPKADAMPKNGRRRTVTTSLNARKVWQPACRK